MELLAAASIAEGARTSCRWRGIAPRTGLFLFLAIKLVKLNGGKPATRCS